jgi:predicted glycosyltransferase
MRAWIDLANCPHVLLFAPLIRRLEERGHDVVLTARDHAQTVELARERWPRVEVIGGSSPKGRTRKAATMAERARQLVRWARAERPDLALCHNSYGQLIAARALGIRSLNAMDFEHQPLNNLSFRLADRLLLPAALLRSGVRRQGASPRKTRYYDGLKEELYLGDFEPDADVPPSVGFDRGRWEILVVGRTPPSRAIYHRFGNPLFLDALRSVGRHEGALCVVLARFPEERAALCELGLPNLVVPRRAVDSRSLMYAADLVLGGGGTMTREAALLGVPTYTLFAGKPPAVDLWLEQRGLLRRLRSSAELAAIAPRAAEPDGLARLRMRGEELIELFLREATELARSGAPGVKLQTGYG